MISMNLDRTHHVEDINAGMKGQEVILGGWVEDLRKMGKMTFLTLRDVTGIIQIILTDDVMKSIEDITRQSVVRVTGKIQDTKARDFECEIKADGIDVLTKAVHPLPIDPIGRLESHIDNRLNSRALDMRNQKTASIFKVRHHVLASLRKRLSEKKFIEITTPKIIGSASEGGANLFSLDYFGKQAYLAQSPQLYKEQMTIGLERVFEIASFYRAEKSHTGRHLSEFTSVDIEAAFMDYTDVMNVLEDLVLNTFKYVSENCKEEQEILGNEITIPNSPFKKITYSEALEELNRKDAKLEFGDDLLDSHLRIIGENHPGFYFITDWPIKLKPFYIMEKEDTPEISESFDLQFGYLELSSGGSRLHNPEKIKIRLSEQNLDPAK
ncbi:MAG TPA: aspartate--tRNA(Asn) ligase, partial [Candidatus Nitrosopelagicus sp.]|nr:aspartate--tRNA(Asn) ligase [Candidatus Nitrosopelagicus sp.]